MVATLIAWFVILAMSGAVVAVYWGVARRRLSGVAAGLFAITLVWAWGTWLYAPCEAQEADQERIVLGESIC
jgi:hypothetical protein